MKKLGMDYPTGSARSGAARRHQPSPSRFRPLRSRSARPLYAASDRGRLVRAPATRESEAEIARKYLESRHVTMEQAQVQAGYAPARAGAARCDEKLGRA